VCVCVCVCVCVWRKYFQYVLFNKSLIKSLKWMRFEFCKINFYESLSIILFYIVSPKRCNTDRHFLYFADDYKTVRTRNEYAFLMIHLIINEIIIAAKSMDILLLHGSLDDNAENP